MRGLFLLAGLVAGLTVVSSNRAYAGDCVAMERKVEQVVVNDSIVDEGVDERPRKKTLNEIRFGGWTDKEWLDNDYIRELRKRIDAYNSGEIVDANSEQYLDYFKGQFVIFNIEPYIMGGAFIYFVFIENPAKVFAVWVYSGVDEEREVVVDYECRSIRMLEKESGFTKEEILEIVEKDPNIKLW